MEIYISKDTPFTIKSSDTGIIIDIQGEVHFGPGLVNTRCSTRSWHAIDSVESAIDALTNNPKNLTVFDNVFRCFNIELFDVTRPVSLSQKEALVNLLNLIKKFIQTNFTKDDEKFKSFFNREVSLFEQCFNKLQREAHVLGKLSDVEIRTEIAQLFGKFIGDFVKENGAHLQSRPTRGWILPYSEKVKKMSFDEMLKFIKEKGLNLGTFAGFFNRVCEIIFDIDYRFKEIDKEKAEVLLTCFEAYLAEFDKLPFEERASAIKDLFDRLSAAYDSFKEPSVFVRNWEEKHLRLDVSQKYLKLLEKLNQQKP